MADSATSANSSTARWPIIGHEMAVEGLRRELERGRLSHAYLFTGPPQVGKATLARVFAQAIFCTGHPAALDDAAAARPCGACRSCRLIARGAYPDFEWYSLETQARENAALSGRSGVNKELSIDTIRQLQRGLAMRPYEGDWRVTVVDDAERLSIPAANALLKTLEEPPPFAILILLAAAGGELLPTIVSRSQLIPLRPVGQGELITALVTQLGQSAERAELLAALSGGRPGWAIARARNPDLLAEREDRFEAISRLPTAGLPQRFNFAAELASRYSQDSAGVHDTLIDLAGWWRDVLVLRLGCPDLLLNIDKRAILAAAANRYTEGMITPFLAAIDETRRQLTQNVSPRLAIEELMLKLP